MTLFYLFKNMYLFLPQVKIAFEFEVPIQIYEPFFLQYKSDRQQVRMSMRKAKKSDSFTGIQAQGKEMFFISNGIRKRKIYYNVNYTQTEQKWISTVRKALKQQKNISIEEDPVILRYFYSADLQLDKCIERLVKYHEWFNNPEIQIVTDNTNNVFKEGFVYSYGKTKDGRPFIAMNLGVFDLNKHSLNSYYQAMNNVLNRVLSEEFVPGSIENYYFILDIDEKLLSLPLSSLADIIKVIGNAYSMCLQKMLIVNTTTLSKWLYNRVTNFIAEETARKITLYTKDDLMEGNLREYIDADVLEKKYGGERENIDHVKQFKLKERMYWPVDQLSQTQYFSIQQNQDQFKEQASACCTNQQCQIY